jgi:hypothetical protein
VDNRPIAVDDGVDDPGFVMDRLGITDGPGPVLVVSHPAQGRARV